MLKQHNEFKESCIREWPYFRSMLKMSRLSMLKSRIELIFGHKLGIFFRFHMPYFIWVSLIYKNRYDRLYLVHCIQNPYFAHFLVGIFETKLLALHMLHVYENLSMLFKKINLNACTFLLIRLASFLVKLIISGTDLVH